MQFGAPLAGVDAPQDSRDGHHHAEHGHGREQHGDVVGLVGERRDGIVRLGERCRQAAAGRRGVGGRGLRRRPGIAEPRLDVTAIDGDRLVGTMALRKMKTGALHRGDALCPARSEGAPSPQRFHEGETTRADHGDQAIDIGAFVERAQRRLADMAVGRNAERALQPLDRLRRAGIHGAVVDGQVDAGRQLVAAHRVPVLVAVDVVALGVFHLVDIAQPQTLAAAPAVIDALDHALIGAPAGIVRVVHLAALEREHGAFAIREVCRCHGLLNEKSPPKRAVVV
jgi:hypothetical protein